MYVTRTTKSFPIGNKTSALIQKEYMEKKNLIPETKRIMKKLKGSKSIRLGTSQRGGTINLLS